MTDTLTLDAMVEDVARAIANATRPTPAFGDAYDCLRSWACPDGPEQPGTVGYNAHPDNIRRAQAEWRQLHDVARLCVAAVAKAAGVSLDQIAMVSKKASWRSGKPAAFAAPHAGGGCAVSDVPWGPQGTLCHRLAALAAHIKRMDSGSGDAKLILEAASEIGRLRHMVRVNAIRHGATHAEVDVLLDGEAAP